MVTNTALWQAINAFDMDAADAAFPFSRRLARDNGWSHSFAKAAITDYKRFIYLICVSGTMLTPSDVIDEVWHLHLIYSEDYWDRFCFETLKRKIHHGPTKGGDAEAGKYLNAYQHTLDLYQQEFGTPPPPALWPDEKTRFQRPRSIQRIDISDKIILPKRQVFLCLSLGLPLLLAACNAKHIFHQIDQYYILIIIGVVFGFNLILALLRHMGWVKPARKGKDDGSGCGGGGCSSSDGGGHGCGGHGCGGGGGCGGCGGD